LFSGHQKLPFIILNIDDSYHSLFSYDERKKYNIWHTPKECIQLDHEFSAYKDLIGTKEEIEQEKRRKQIAKKKN
jgi:hypothetical protein